MHKIIGWLVQTSRETHGPFSSAAEAGQYIEEHHQSLAGPFSLVPMRKPRKMPGTWSDYEQRFRGLEESDSIGDWLGPL